MAQGANGLVYGRNIYQHPDMALVTAALLAIIHEGATGADAWDLYRSRTSAAVTV
jgi:DhnA family fructose-bisphosphate aldolase class Ia